MSDLPTLDSTITMTLTQTTTRPHLGDESNVVMTTLFSATTIPNPSLASTPSAYASGSSATDTSVFSRNSGTSNAWKVGLAIGIPGIVAAIIGLVAFLLISLKKRSSTNTPLRYNKSLHTPAKSFSSFSSEDLEKNDPLNEPIPSRESPNSPHKWHAVQNRLSRLFFPESTRDWTQEPVVSQVIKDPHPVTEAHRSPLTAILLKKFNLRSKLRAITPTFGKAQNDSSSHSLGILRDILSPIIAPPFAARSGNSVLDEYLVIRRYALQLPDELGIEVGDKLIVSELFSDGWCKASRGKSIGMVPQVCLQKL